MEKTEVVGKEAATPVAERTVEAIELRKSHLCVRVSDLPGVRNYQSDENSSILTRKGLVSL